MRVLLADPPAKGTKVDNSYANLGLLYLASSLKAGFEQGDLEVGYLGPNHDVKSHVERVRDFRPDVYGISFTSKAAGLSYRTIKAVKETCPNTRIVAGGCHPSALPDDVFKSAPVDVVGLAEGEITFTEIVRAIAEHEKPDFESVAGVVFRRNGDLVRTSDRPFIKDLDTIPLPAWELVDFREYPGMHLKKQPIEASLLISRGCPFYCSFCSQPIWKSQKPWVRVRSIENIFREIDLLYGRGVCEIYLTSDEMNFDEKWAIDLCQQIAARNYPDLYFQCNLRADKVSPALVEAMAAAKFWMVHLGVESANDRVLNGIRKKVTVGQIEEAARCLSLAGIKVFAFMMLYQAWEEDGKLQWETPQEVENTIRWARKMFKERSIHYMSWQFCTPMPGARLYEIAKRHNLYRGEEQRVYEGFDEHEVCMNLPGVSPRTMSWQLKKGVLWKDWFMVRSGNISPRHVWRVWENLRALVK